MRLLVINENVLFYKDYVENVKTEVIYKKISSSFLKLVRMLHLKSGLPFYYLWFTEKFRTIGKCENEVLLFDTVLTVPAANYLRRRFPSMRIVYWFWNHIYDVSILHHLDKGIELWSYDKKDCESYGLSYNTQFYFPKYANYHVEQYSIEQDFFFVGVEKGRKKYIDECLSLIREFTYKFIVSGNTRMARVKNWMPYEQVVDNIRRSRCVVDIVPDAQKGLTLRPLEALFLRKKLLTNFSAIKNQDFYSPNNIFIMNEDDERCLKDFINAPLSLEHENCIMEYSFASWLKRFSAKEVRVN